MNRSDRSSPPPSTPSARALPPGARLAEGRIHYGWIVAVLGMATTFASLGIARFSLGMLLPAMRIDLNLSYTDMGFVSTGNFVGYLVAALVCGRIVRVFGARKVIVGGLVMIALSLLLVATASSVALVWPAYLVTGLGSGTAYVAASGLIPHWFSRRLRGRAAGILVIGSGPAIVLSGILVPTVIGRLGPPGWRTGWVILGAIVALVALVVGLWVRNHPSELGLDVHTHGADAVPTADSAGSSSPAPSSDAARAADVPVAIPAADAPAAAADPTPAPSSRLSRTALQAMLHLGLIYFLFGCTYVVYITFIVTSLVQEHGFSQREAGYFWVIVGACSMLSGPPFGALSDRVGRGVGLATVFTLHGLSYLAISQSLPLWGVYASVVLFGVAAFAIPGIMVAAVGDYLPATQAASVFGTLTVAFGIGQAVGPVVAGAIAERTGGFSAAFLLAAVLSAGGLVLSLALRPPAQTPAS